MDPDLSSRLRAKEFLKEFADMLNKVFKDSIVAHFSNDNFVVITKNEAIYE